MKRRRGGRCSFIGSDVPNPVEGHWQVVLSERDDPSSQPSHLPLAELAGLEVEADPDREPENQRTNTLTGRLVVGNCRQLVDPFPVSAPVLLRELRNSPRGVSEGGA